MNPSEDIVDAENARINEKYQSLQNLQFGKQRILELNKNFQERTTAFNLIIITFFITLAIIILLLFLSKMFYGMEDIINTIIFIVLFSGIGYCIYLSVSFIKRDPADFEKIMYSPNNNNVTTQSPNQAAASASTQYSINATK
jgi:hypothetical protein